MLVPDFIAKRETLVRHETIKLYRKRITSGFNNITGKVNEKALNMVSNNLDLKLSPTTKAQFPSL